MDTPASDVLNVVDNDMFTAVAAVDSSCVHGANRLYNVTLILAVGANDAGAELTRSIRD